MLYQTIMSKVLRMDIEHVIQLIFIPNYFVVLKLNYLCISKKSNLSMPGKIWSFAHLAKEPAQLLLFTIRSLNGNYLVVWTKILMEKIYVLVVSKKNVLLWINLTYWSILLDNPALLTLKPKLIHCNY